MKSRKAALIIAVFVIVGVLSLAPLITRGIQTGRGDSLSILGTVPHFLLQDSYREAFSLDRLREKVWVVDFIFTTCTDVGPEMSGKMAALHRMYHGQEDIRFISISADPDYDTPDVLAHYAELYEADTSRWHFLTGSFDAIQRLAVEGFKLGSMDNPQDHSTRFVLVDQRGRIRGYYDSGDDLAVERLAHDIASLLSERSS